jgi:hypothetical protein
VVRRGSAKPLFTGSNPVVASNFLPRAPLVLLLLLSVLGCASAPVGPPPDPNGDRFLCGPRDARSVCLSVPLREGCALRFVEGESIPPEAEERIVVRRPSGEETQVHSPADLAGCVRIASAADALEYLRLFSSFKTVHLVEPQRLEVFPGPSPACVLTCLRSGIWRTLGLTAPRVTPRGDGSFEVRRVLMKPKPYDWMPTLYRTVELVKPDGSVEVLSETRVRALPEDLADLAFPMYL